MKETATASLRRALPVLVPILILGLGPFAVGPVYGKGWRIVAAAFALLIWLLARPWRFGLAAPHERLQVRWSGTVALCGMVLTHAITYYKL